MVGFMIGQIKLVSTYLSYQGPAISSSEALVPLKLELFLRLAYLKLFSDLNLSLIFFSGYFFLAYSIPCYQATCIPFLSIGGSGFLSFYLGVKESLFRFSDRTEKEMSSTCIKGFTLAFPTVNQWASVKERMALDKNLAPPPASSSNNSEMTEFRHPSFLYILESNQEKDKLTRNHVVQSLFQ